jgi:hypothetical protein
MGQEIECKIRYRERLLAGKARLETDHVLFCGEERLKVVFKDVQGARAEDGILRLDFVGGPAELDLGAVAEKWANKILHPPSLLHKLGVNSGMAVRLVGEFDREFRADLNNCRVEAAGERADLIFLAAERSSRLLLIRKLLEGMKPDGALWVVYPKGATAIRETEVLRAGRSARLKDVKAASFSLTHTGLKFVVPRSLRECSPFSAVSPVGGTSTQGGPDLLP